ncbi:MAG TPA: GNAT family N-acetyltransferase [Flavobacteriales bacterium]|jgi:predicted GNAT family N-acyltransferase|nr:GNAT family N-acetyltransferase [Salibacteraceae bacterium]HAS36486.1 GNAT family N-acetyltransferase [Flavobacteriales bacterium]
MDKIEIRIISPEETHDIRHEVLRKGQDRSTVIYSEDSMPGSFHMGIFHKGEHMGIASFYPENHPNIPMNFFRLRGMASRENVQGKGFGSLLIQASMKEIIERNGKGIWCNARTSASKFYSKHKFERVDEEFDIAGIGPHYLMKLDL